MSDTRAIAVFERFDMTNVLLFIRLLGVSDVSTATMTNIRPTLFVFSRTVSVLRFVRVDSDVIHVRRSSTVPNRRLIAEKKAECTKQPEEVYFSWIGGGWGVQKEIQFRGAL